MSRTTTIHDLDTLRRIVKERDKKQALENQRHVETGHPWRQRLFPDLHETEYWLAKIAVDLADGYITAIDVEQLARAYDKEGYRGTAARLRALAP